MVNYYSNRSEVVNGQNRVVQGLELMKHAMNQLAMIMVIDVEGNIIDINDNYCATLKYSLRDVYMRDFRTLYVGYHSEEFFGSLERTLRTGEEWTGEICKKAGDGKVHWLKSVIIPVDDEVKSVSRFHIVSVDITEQKNNEQWQYLACHNELTSLPNRRMLDLSIDTYIGRVKQQNQRMALLFLDINHFKKINDTYGHAIGDLFLKEVASRLSNLSIIQNHVFHLCGDEFIMLLEDVENIEEQVRLILSLFDNAFEIEAYPITASVSIGISMYPDHATDRDALINYADIAMFEAKQSSGNSYQIYQ